MTNQPTMPGDPDPIKVFVTIALIVLVMVFGVKLIF